MKKYFKENLLKFVDEVNPVKSVRTAFDMLNLKYKLEKILGEFTVSSAFMYENGSNVGDFLQHVVVHEYTKNSKSGYTFIFGADETTNVDHICKENSYFSSEYKSTSQNRNTPVGTSTHINFGETSKKHKKDKYEFYVFTPYRFTYKTSDDLCSLRFIAVGMLKPSDWIRTGENGNGATISTETFINQFIIVWINPDEKLIIKSPELNLKKLNINNGEIISLCDTKNTIIDATVFDAEKNLVRCDGNLLLLKDATKKFGKKSYVTDIKKYWYYKGKNLTEINKYTYCMTYLNDIINNAA